MPTVLRQPSQERHPGVEAAASEMAPVPKGLRETPRVLGTRSWLTLEEDEHKGEDATAFLSSEKALSKDHVAPERRPIDWSIDARLAITCAGGYCLNYFMRFPIFMLRDDISKQMAGRVFGVDFTLQEALTVVYCVGFGLAKVPAIYIMSSPFYFRHRLPVLSAFVLSSALLTTLPLALTQGATTPTILGVFLGCFPSSMLYGGLVSYVEGRRSTEVLVAVVHFFSTAAPSASRGVATAALAMGMEQCWMPALIAAAFLPATLGLLWALDRSPAPTAEDVAQRRPRRAMSAEERSAFLLAFRPGLVLIIASYAMLAALRFFRDLYSRDIFTAANHGQQPSALAFALADLPGATFTSIALVLFSRVEDGGRALLRMHLAMLAFLAVAAGSTVLYAGGYVDGVSWQLALGTGIYGAYSIGGVPLFDRLISISGLSGATCTFLVFLSDMCGYIAAVSLLLWKTFCAGNPSPERVLEQFLGAVGWLSLCIAFFILASYQYFKARVAVLADKGLKKYEDKGLKKYEA